MTCNKNYRMTVHFSKEKRMTKARSKSRVVASSTSLVKDMINEFVFALTVKKEMIWVEAGYSCKKHIPHCMRYIYVTGKCIRNLSDTIKCYLGFLLLYICQSWMLQNTHNTRLNTHINFTRLSEKFKLVI